MKRKICLVLALMIGLFLVIPQVGAQTISGWWSGKGSYEQGDFVIGEWTNLQARGKKVSYLYIFQDTANTGIGYFLIWDDVTTDYLLETYSLFYRNGIVVLFIPTFIDTTTGYPAGSTLVLRPYGSASIITAMKGYYTLYDMETEGSTDQFVRMGSVVFNRVMVNLVPELAKQKVPFP